MQYGKIEKGDGMKLFINDWDGSIDKFVPNTEENREYPIDKWITFGNGKRSFLASVYVYDEFVMFFYIHTIDLVQEYMEYTSYVAPKINRDWAAQPKKGNLMNMPNYEVNHLKSKQSRGGACLPTQTYEEEYDYLFALTKERVPEELKGKTLAFRKDCLSFEKPVDEIKHFAIFPNKHESRYHFIDKTFTLPFGRSGIKIEYAESYVIIHELKIYNMLESLKGQQYEEDLREFYDKNLLIISYSAPEEQRSFEFYLKEYLAAKVEDNLGGNQIWLYSFDGDDDDKRKSVLCEIKDSPQAEYEITLMWAIDSIQHERKAVFEMTMPRRSLLSRLFGD